MSVTAIQATPSQAQADPATPPPKIKSSDIEQGGGDGKVVSRTGD
jgi:hypothetical protein